MTCRTMSTPKFISNNSSIRHTLSFTLNRSAELRTGCGEQILVKQQHPMMHDGVYPFKRTSFILICKTVYLYIVATYFFPFSFFLFFLDISVLLFPFFPFLLSFFSLPFFLSLSFALYPSLPFWEIVFVVVDVDFYQTLQKKLKKLIKWLGHWMTKVQCIWVRTSLCLGCCNP